MSGAADGGGRAALSGGWMRGEERREEEEEERRREERRGRMRAGIHQTPSSPLREQRSTEHAPISSSRMSYETLFRFMSVHIH